MGKIFKLKLLLWTSSSSVHLEKKNAEGRPCSPSHGNGPSLLIATTIIGLTRKWITPFPETSNASLKRHSSEIGGKDEDHNYACLLWPERGITNSFWRSTFDIKITNSFWRSTLDVKITNSFWRSTLAVKITNSFWRSTLDVKITNGFWRSTLDVKDVSKRVRGLCWQLVRNNYSPFTDFGRCLETEQFNFTGGQVHYPYSRGSFQPLHPSPPPPPPPPIT